MVTPPQRGKLLDAAITGFFLIVFGAVPIALLLSQENRRFQNDKLETAFIAVVVLSWPLFAFGGALLLYFWNKDRSVDKVYFSTATPRHLSMISGALVSNTFACILLLTGIVLSTVNVVSQNTNRILIAVNVVAMLLLIWIAYVFYTVISDVRRSKQTVEEFAQRHAFENPSQDPSRQQGEAGDAQQPSAHISEPVFV